MILSCGKIVTVITMAAVDAARNCAAVANGVITPSPTPTSTIARCSTQRPPYS